MTKTYAQLQKQIATLTRQAEALRQKEIAGIAKEIKRTIAAHGLTAADLGFAPKKQVRQAAAGKAAPHKTGKKSKSTSKPKYRDGAGNTWSGRGPRPLWLRDQLEQGRTLEDFAV